MEKCVSSILFIYRTSVTRKPALASIIIVVGSSSSSNNNNNNSRVADVERVAKGNDVLCDLWEDLKWHEYLRFRYLLLNTTLAQLLQPATVYFTARSSLMMMMETG